MTAPQLPPFGGRCAWCLAADWMLGELAVAPLLYGAIFHNRSGVVPVPGKVFDPAYFDPAYFDELAEPATKSAGVPGPCYGAAVNAGLVQS